MANSQQLTANNMDRRNFLKKSGWTVLGLAATGSVLGVAGCTSEKESGKYVKAVPAELKKMLEGLGEMKIWWGDVHNHCNVTYGHGELSDAIAAAKEQLDFVSITPHALWPDIPGKGDPRLEWVIEYHESAFRRLRAGGWEPYVKALREANVDEKFLTFTSYECHSMEHGDHVALCYDYDTPLLECKSVPDLKRKLKKYKAFVTPHHMGYITGFRGYNWDAFKQDEQTPFVEMYSRHGLAENDQGDMDYLHDMGPRTWEGSVQYGLDKGHKFGLMCSTDQHAGYPGSYGDGRIGVVCDKLDKESLWNAMAARHVCGATGDKIKIDFRINGARMGDVTSGNTREIYVAVEAMNHIDYVDIIKNGQCLSRLSAPHTVVKPTEQTIRAKVKIDFGWNREEEYVHWQGRLRLSEGTLNGVQPCFRGAAFTSPQPGEPEFRTRVNRILNTTDKSVELDLYSTKNPNTTTPATQGVVLDVTMPRNGKIIAEVNGQKFAYTLDELLEGSKAHFMRGWLSEAVQFHRAATENTFAVGEVLTDNCPEKNTDYYYVRVRQRNGQWAWSSPIWVEKN